MKKKEKKQYEDTRLVVSKDRRLIEAKFNSSLLEQKIFNIALSRIEIIGSQENYRIVARLYPGDIKSLLGKDKSDKNIYNQLKKVAVFMPGHSMIIEDGLGNFHSMAVITNARYINKILEIEFNRDFKNYIADAQKPHAKLFIPLLNSFSKTSSYRIYELLKKEMYRSNKDINQGMIKISYNVSEFKFLIGLANGEEDGVKRYIENSKFNIDWDYVYENIAKEKMYPVWADLRKRVLEPAQEELKMKSDIVFDFEGRAVGGTKIRMIDFFVYPNPNYSPNASLINSFLEDEKKFKAKVAAQGGTDAYGQYELFQFTYPSLYNEYIDHNGLTSADIDLFLETAGYDENLIRNAIDAADRQPCIDNYIGWIIKCIERGGYSEPIAVINGSSQKAEEVMKIKEDMKKEEVKRGAWERVKSRDDINMFLDYVGFDLMVFETIYSPEESIDMYFQWKRGEL